MMQNAVIYKYELHVGAATAIVMPAGAIVLTVQMQGNRLVMWALLDATLPLTETRTFRVVGTGHPIPDIAQLHYLGTAQMHGFGLVWHVYEKFEVQ